MKTTLIVIVLAVISGCAATTPEQQNTPVTVAPLPELFMPWPPVDDNLIEIALFKCGIPPNPPIRCGRSKAVCVCDEDGNCRWQFYC